MNSVYVFQCTTHDEQGRVVEVLTHRHNGTITWSEHLEAFANFLRGCGYVLPDGELDFVDESNDA